MSPSGDLFERWQSSAMVCGARFSPDRRYRYRLWREWGDPEKRCVWVMLNPSIAGEDDDDPTVRKCIGFAKRWGFGAIDVVNLFALVSTHPSGLLFAEDPVGPANAEAMAEAFRGARRIVRAWGTHGPRIHRLCVAQAPKLAHAMIQHMRIPCETGTLGRTNDGSPRHPLMLPYATPWCPG